MVALIGFLVGALYLVSPIAQAVGVAGAIQRRDSAALSERIDWNSLAPAVETELAREAMLPEATPGFLVDMAQELGRRLTSPEELTALLYERFSDATARGRDMLGAIRILGLDRWEVTLTAPHSPGRRLRMELTLADPIRLRWVISAVALPSRAGRL
ncbi:DUF2939 domain-containing protein [Roseococcus sp. YIM B11640]|uniref:DUF2939 domain-containing protein n=1 Tax=Roseococcus sp. YIM B11640 TaxID=3133973 RepID=UPI003C7B9903